MYLAYKLIMIVIRGGAAERGMDMDTRFLDVPGGRLAYDSYDEASAGPLVVCAPSIGDLRGEYRFLAPRLAAAGYRVVAFDVRGLGESSARWADYSAAAVGADMLAFARALGVGPAFLIGTSFAGGAAIWAAAEAPEAVAGLVLIGAGAGGVAGPRWRLRLTYGPLFARPGGTAVWLRYFASLYPTARPDDWAAYTARLRANLREPGRLAALRRQIYALPDGAAQVAARFGRVAAPALVVMGARDRDFKDPAGEARLVAGRLSRSTVRLIEDAGHYPHAEMPERTGPEIVAFLDGIRDGAGREAAAHGA